MSLHPMWLSVLITLAALGWFGWSWWRGRTHQNLRRALLAGLCLIVSLRPVIGSAAALGATSDVDVLLLVDRTTSMSAEDHTGGAPRIKGVGPDIATITEKYAGARFALVTFTSEAYQEVPFTTDTNAVNSLASTVSTESYLDSSGSSISAGLALSAKVLAGAAKDKPDHRRILVYFGDGEQTAADAPQSFAPLKPLLSGGAVLGYGTDSGGRMRAPYGTGYVSGSGPGDGLSVRDTANLKKIASDLGVPYADRTAGQAIDVPSRGGSFLGGGTVTGGTELAWLFGLGILGLTAWELAEQATAWRRVRRFTPQPATQSAPTATRRSM